MTRATTAPRLLINPEEEEEDMVAWNEEHGHRVERLYGCTVSSFDATIPALDAETSALGAAIARRSFDATISALDAETRALGAAPSAIARSYRRGDVGDRAELPAISTWSFRRYRRLRSWYNSAAV